MTPLSRLQLLLAMTGISLLSACGAGDDDDSTPSTDCPDDELFVAAACEEEYCGAPEARLGTGSGAYEGLTDGQELPIVFGAQGGYHIDMAVEMDNLCPIVFLRPSATLIGLDGTPAAEAFFDQNRHVQAVRVEPYESPLQQFWGLRVFVPCEHWPNDPERELECAAGAGSAGHLEDFEVELRIEVEDHNGRITSDTKRVQPYCCND